MFDRLIVDTEVLRDTATNLDSVRIEFDTATATSEDVAAAVGHADLAERVRAFASNWDKRRSELVGQLTTVCENLVTAADDLESADKDLGCAIEGVPTPISAVRLRESNHEAR